MKQTLLQEKYPVYTLEVMKTETSHPDVDSILAYLRDCVEQHPVSRMIAEFDHYAHTSALPQGEIAPDIQAAKHIVFCFGTHLPNAQVMAVRPRSIGVVDQGDRFIISFLEAPMPLANNAMEGWVKALVD
ncbi:hypothetical protein F2Q65_07310 [Thiohalocapsa marina]|uniref:Uncharacterized protein n=1 Tax=Thiohalocapsa marina TaxID=424902 RepID=A0A5M8FSS5_9GAMM|nr:hypothetical protein [Thiohalocapsa marina]KAA6185802.1 hypothetical protein F2Q65_07310 [Thiohalocapsa marina]